MTGLAWTLLGLAAVCVVIVVRMLGDEVDGLRAENGRLERRIKELEG